MLTNNRVRASLTIGQGPLSGRWTAAPPGPRSVEGASLHVHVWVLALQLDLRPNPPVHLSSCALRQEAVAECFAVVEKYYLDAHVFDGTVVLCAAVFLETSFEGFAGVVAERVAPVVHRVLLPNTTVAPL